MLRKLAGLASALALLLAAVPVLGAQEAPGDSQANQYEPAQGTVVTTGVLEKPGVTTYMYGTHTITDEASGTSYALKSESVDLDSYVGQRVTVYGTPVPGYQNGAIEGGPPLLDVTQVSGGSGAASPTDAGFLQYGDNAG